MLSRHVASGMGLEDTRPYTDGVITIRKIDGRKGLPSLQDFTVFGGAVGERTEEKIHKIMDMATSMGSADHRIERRGRREDSRGRSRRCTPTAGSSISQRSRVRGRAADLGDPGPVRRGRRLSPAVDGLIFMVKDTRPHVHHLAPTS